MLSPSACGVLGVLRKRGAPRIRGEMVFQAINVVRFRGSRLGAGFALFRLERHRYYRLGVFSIDGDGALKVLLDALSSYGIRVINTRLRVKTERVLDYIVEVDAEDEDLLEHVVHVVNGELWSRNRMGRIYFCSRCLDVMKGVGYPDDVANLYKLYDVEADMWLAHTRQPTNSPGYYPYWSHPFSIGDVAVVHNGDISAFGSNMNFLTHYSGVRSFVGTDSEAVALILHHLIRHERLSVEDAVAIVTNPYPEDVDNERVRGLLEKYRGARLDGPYTLAVGIAHDDDLYLIAIADRQRLRPVVIGEDENYYYVASEEAQIRYVSPRARVWSLRPGSYLIASHKRGIISYGRTPVEMKLFFDETNVRVAPYFTKVPVRGDNVIDARGLSTRELNDLILRKAIEGHKVIKVYNSHGQRYIGINLARHGIKGVRVEIYGVPGNCLANLNHGNEFIVYGNAENDVADTMHDGKVVVHGDARDVLGQALQGGYVFVRGSAENRTGIQMREYRHKRPYMIIGGRVDHYLGEYMAGGVIMVLGIDAFYNNVSVELTGKHVGTGMVGGGIYVRERVPPTRIGLHPPRSEVISFLSALVEEGYLPESIVEELGYSDVKTVREELERRGYGEAVRFVKILIDSDHVPRPTCEYRELTEDEIREVAPVLRMYREHFSLPETFVDDMLSCKYTHVFREPRR